MIFMPGHKNLDDHYDIKKSNPFSTNGDRFKTIMLRCDFEKKISPNVPLTLEGYGSDWKVEINSPVRFKNLFF